MKQDILLTITCINTLQLPVVYLRVKEFKCIRLQDASHPFYSLSIFKKVRPFTIYEAITSMPYSLALNYPSHRADSQFPGARHGSVRG